MRWIIPILLIAAAVAEDRPALVTFYQGSGSLFKAAMPGAHKALRGTNVKLYDGQTELAKFNGSSKYGTFRFTPGKHYFAVQKPMRPDEGGLPMMLASGEHRYVRLQSYLWGFSFAKKTHVEVIERTCQEAVIETPDFQRIKEKNVKARLQFEREGGLPKCD